jgi:cytidylate kinase
MTAGTRAARVRPVIAIDGPAGAGKSTLAAYLARQFGFLNLETGAMYRALALKALETGTPLDEPESLTRLMRATEIQLEALGAGNRVLLDGRDVSGRIRDKDVAEAASRVSVHPAVRAWMVERQRAMGGQGGVVMEGRDIGTQVFPDAEVKIFLDAVPEVRGQRRFLQDRQSGKSLTQEDVIAAVRERDGRDRARAVSPLEPAADAVLLDTTGLTLEEVCARAEQLVRARWTGE